MNDKAIIVVTSISPPNEAMRALAFGGEKYGCRFIVIGDETSPADFQLTGCDFYSLSRQKNIDLKFAQICPPRHYARKNIGYLLAMQEGSRLIIETDDDNIPRESFWADRQKEKDVPVLTEIGWINVYRYFTDTFIWPRGLSLEAVQQDVPALDIVARRTISCPIQQNLADNNPDVDAIYRLLFSLPQNFHADVDLALGTNAWCPFNSQNTTWWPEAFELLYLPSYCSFRMTDIWRSFVAQRIAWENGWGIYYGPATVEQFRNEHNLMQDFQDEVPGYVNNSRIIETFASLVLYPGVDRVGENMMICYEALVSMSLVDQQELVLLEAWQHDTRHIRLSSSL